MEWVLRRINDEIKELTSTVEKNKEEFLNNTKKSLDDMTVTAKKSMDETLTRAKKSLSDLTQIAPEPTPKANPIPDL